MITFTLDTNCIIALDESRAEAAPLQQLVLAHTEGRARVAIGLISASENPRPWTDERFLERIARLGLDDLDKLYAMAIAGLAIAGMCVPTGPEYADLAGKLQHILFPEFEADWQAYCTERGIAPEDQRKYDRWQRDVRNQACDIEGLRCHARAGRDVFVTSDENYLLPEKLAKLLPLTGGRIMRPADAAALL